MVKDYSGSAVTFDARTEVGFLLQRIFVFEKRNILLLDLDAKKIHHYTMFLLE